MAINIDPSTLMEIQDLITESQDPTAQGRGKRKMSVEDIKLYDWERMSEKEKAEAAGDLGMPVKELDNRLREKNVETKMEFNIEGDEKATSKLQKSAQAMIDAYGGNMSGSGFDRDMKMFENAYGSEMADKLVSQLRPKTDSNVSKPEGSASTTIGGGDVIPSASEINTLIDEAAEKKKQAFIDSLNKKGNPDLTEELKFVDQFDESQKKGSDPFAGSSTPVFIDSESTDVEDMLRTVPSQTVDALEPKDRIDTSDAKYTDETITKEGDHGDPFAGTNLDVFSDDIVLTADAMTDEERRKLEEDRLVEQFIEGNLPEGKKKGAGKEKVKKFFKNLVGKNKNKNDKQDFPEFTGDEMDKYYNNGGKLSGGQYKLDKNKDGKISGADFKMMKEGGRMNYMGGGRIKPFMAYLMGGRTNKY
jgi:hypothetical protein